MTATRSTRWVLALFVLFALVAASCGSDDDNSASQADADAGDTAAADTGGGDAELTTITFQLDWVPNTNHTGIYAADVNGYYAEEGIQLEILPYSGGNGDTIVAEGLADFAVSFQNSITLARPAGVPIKAVASITQHTVEAIGVKADRDDIASPKDLDGLTYAGFGGPFEVPVMKAVIQADGGTGEFETVVLDTAAYEAVYNGAADFVIPFLTWEGIEAELREEPMKYFEYADFGLPDQYSVILVASEEWLADNGDLATRFLRATKKGFEWGAANPQDAADLLIEANPGVFNEPELVERSQALMADEFFLDENGDWGTIDLDRFAAYSGFLFDAGIVTDGSGNPLAEEPDWSEFVDTSFLN